MAAESHLRKGAATLGLVALCCLAKHPQHGPVIGPFQVQSISSTSMTRHCSHFDGIVSWQTLNQFDLPRFGAPLELTSWPRLAVI